MAFEFPKLLKPFGFERFVKAVNRAIVVPGAEMVGTVAAAVSAPSERSIFVKADKRHHQLTLADICYVEACGNYCVVRSSRGSVIAHQGIRVRTGFVFGAVPACAQVLYSGCETDIVDFRKCHDGRRARNSDPPDLPARGDVAVESQQLIGRTARITSRKSAKS